MKKKIVEIELLDKKNNTDLRITINTKIDNNFNNSEILKKIEDIISEIFLSDNFEIQSIWFSNDDKEINDDNN